MKQVRLLHNPSAGDEEHDKDHLIKIIEKNGFECSYSSTKKKGWKDFENGLELLAIAGGDGTVRKVVKALLERKMHEKIWPIGLIPLGTANNIGKTLNLHEKETADVVAAWNNCNIKKFDVGMFYELEEASFFLESFGYGIFPYLMREIKKQEEKKEETPDEAIKRALKLLHEIILSYEPRHCNLTIDGVDHSGIFIMAEIMNTQSIGPNLHLAPFADPGDGLFEIVLIPENDKKKFGDFVWKRINGEDIAYDYSTIQAKEVIISWDGTHVHVDDEVLKIKKDMEVKVEMKEGLLEFLV
jgi:diacylglycerol kinase family enzyme